MHLPIVRRTALMALATLALTACADQSTEQTRPTIERVFWQTADGEEVTHFTLRNAHGVEVSLIEYGAAISSLRTPDREGRPAEIVFGFDSLDPYLAGVPYFGAIVGRYGNRIARGRFQLDGASYTLATNNGANHLHGGDRGFDKRVWSGESFSDEHGPGVRFTYVSADGEEGYPGALTAHVTYQLGDDNTLTLTYEASTTKPTPVNLTNHAYFNLSGDMRRDILGQRLRINADRFTPVDETLIPTGELRPVEGTAFDFRQSTSIGARIDGDDAQLRNGIGYDHNWVLNQSEPNVLVDAAELYDPGSGRVMTIRTTEPGLQFYSGNFLDGTIEGRNGPFAYRSAAVLETQHFPDSPNQSAFPSTILRPGETYRSQTILAFSTR